MRPFLALSLVALVAAASLACASSPDASSATAAPAAMTALFPPASKPLVLRSSDHLAELVEAFSAATGIAVLADPDARRVLAVQPLGIDAPREIAPADVYPFVESILVQNECVFALASTRAPRILRIVSLRGFGADRYRNLAMPVDVAPADLDAWAGTHPATPLRVLLEVESGDAGELVDVLKGEISDGVTQSVARLGRSRYLVLFGFAPWLRAQRDLLARLDVPRAAAR